MTNTPTGLGNPTTSLSSGMGADTVNVQATTGPLNIFGQHGIDTVMIGNAGSVQAIMGAVSVSNAAGLTDLTIDDSADAVGRMATLTAAAITGLAPAMISFVALDLRSLLIEGGGGGNTFTVADTPAGLTMTLDSGTGADTVNVQGTTGDLDLDGQDGMDTVTIGNAGNVQGITGEVSVSNDLSFTALTVDDSADAVARIATITATAITGLGPPISIMCRTTCPP